ncbi:hypothetical protein LguiB_018706 [Lonicera macranthoides]
MASAGSLQLSHGFGIGKSCRCNKQTLIGRGTNSLHLLGTNLSSLASQRDSLSILLSDKLHRPISAVPHRCNLPKCRSFLNPGQAFDISSVKNATLALTRSCSAFQSRPLLLKLVPAVGIVAFAIWGLGPIMHHIQNLFLHKSDSNWKKSSTYYVMTSYVQPLLLWTGATLICRSLDPVVLSSEAGQIVKFRLLNFVRSLSTVLAFAYCLSRRVFLIQQAQKFFMETNDPTDTRNMGFQFAGRAVYTAVWVAAVSLFMELLGFSTQKWLTAGGLGTVLLTLAGREIFTNFLSSAMIHATRPFVVNEWIQTKIEGYEVSGTVEHVGWWSPTIIRGEDREAVHIPNHKFTVNVVRNLTQKTHWRIKTHLAISHLDVNKINIIVADMRKVLAKNPQVEQQKLHRRVFLENVDRENQALLILISCFVKTSHFEEYLCVKSRENNPFHRLLTRPDHNGVGLGQETILLDLLRVISHHRARLATPIRTVQKIYSDSELEGIPFADSVFPRGGGAPSNRPLMLIEPAYKINGEDRTKTQARTARTNGEPDGKAAVRPTPDKKATDAKSEMTQMPPDSKAKEKPLQDSKTIEVPMPSIKANAENSPVSDNKQKPKQGSERSDGKSGMTQTSNPKAKEKPLVESKIREMPMSDMKGNDGKPPVSDNLSQSGSNKQKPKQGSERSRPALEENIVLGVALEGSKRTLPIEEDMAPSQSPVEGKEMATQRSGTGPMTADKGKKDGHNPNASSTTPADQ